MKMMIFCVLSLAMVAPGMAVEALETEPSALELFLDARMAEVSGAYRRALQLYEEALESEPENVEIRIAYADLLNQAGMPGKAVGLLEGRSDLDWYGRRTRAQILARMAARQPEYLEPAEEELRAVLDERPEDPNVQLSLAQVLLMSNRPGEAEPIVRALREGHGDDVRLIELHARLLGMMGRDAAALELLEQCADTPPTAERCRDRLLDLLQATGRSAEAGRRLVQWTDEEDADARLEAASLLLQGERPAEALRVARGVLAVSPHSVRGRRLEASALADLGRLDEAVRSLRALLRARPEDGESRLLLAWWLAGTGRLDEARGELERVWARVSEGDDPSLRGRSCLTAARIELAADNVTAAREWLGRVEDPEAAGTELPRLLAETYRRREAWRAGVGALLRLQPRLGPEAQLVAIALEAELRLRTGDERGIARLEGIAERNLRGAELAVQVLQTVERWGEAEELASEGLERHPGTTNLLFARAAALERLGRDAEAEDVFRRVLEIEPRHAPAANYLGYMLTQSENHLREALRLIRTAVEVRPDEGAYLDSLGWVHFKLGNLEEAERWLRRAIARETGDGTVYAHLGEVLLRLGRAEEAREMLQRALSLGCEERERVEELLDSTDGDAE